MTNPNFSPVLSTNEIWRDDDTSRCLSDDLDAMDDIHESLPATYANINHTHAGYASASHTHNEYLTYSDVEPVAINNGDDLNDFIDVGVYYRAYSATTSNVVSNCPSDMYSSTFALEVLKAGADGQLIQRATRCHKTSLTIAERVYYQGTWGSWITVFSAV